MNCAILGYGNMGQTRHDAIIQCGGNVKYISDPSIDNGINIDTIINDDTVDVVFICTPNHLNKTYTIQSLSAGKHVFCEKPPTITIDELNQVRECEKSFGKKLIYGFNHRHHESVKLMRQTILSKRLGNIIWMRGRYGKGVDTNFFNTWRANKKLSGGGILLDQGIHLLDLFLYMVGNFDEHKSYISNSFWNIPGIEDNAFILLKKENGITASLHSTMTQWRNLFSFEIFLERGYMVLNGLKTSSNTYGEEKLDIATNDGKIANNLPCETHTYNINNSWKNEVSYFFNCIVNNEPVKIGNSVDALNVLSLIDSIYKENTL